MRFQVAVIIDIEADDLEEAQTIFTETCQHLDEGMLTIENVHQKVNEIKVL